MIEIQEHKEKIKEVQKNINNTINPRKKKELIKYKHRLQKELKETINYIKEAQKNGNK